MDKSRIALAVACAALLVALSGTGYAVATLGRNSVKARHIAPRAVRSSEAHNLLASDFARGQIFRPKGGSKTTSDPIFFTDSPCARPLVSLPLKVTTRSKILALGSATYSHNQDGGSEGSLRVLLRNAGDTTTLAVSRTSIAFGSSTFFETINTGAILHSGAVPSSPSTPFIASPGEYLLVLEGDRLSSCGGPGPTYPYFTEPQLSYALLAP